MNISRRSYLTKIGSVAVAGTAMAIPLARAQTDSGYIEIDVSATIPVNTSIDITLYEDLTGDGTADNQQTKALSDGTNTYVFDVLEGKSNESNTYWMDIALATSDTSITPTLDSALIVLPAAQAPTTTTTTDLAWYESRGESLSNPSRITARISLLLAIVFSILGFIAMRIKSMTGIIGIGMALITLILSMLFDIDFRVFWIAIIFAVVLMVIDVIARTWQGVYS